MSFLVKKIHEKLPKQVHLIPLTHGKVAKVDLADFFTVGQWHWKAQKSAGAWYAVRCVVIDGVTKTIRMHRFLTGCPQGYEVHHKNKDSLDNRMENLLVVTPKMHRWIHSNNGFTE